MFEDIDLDGNPNDDAKNKFEVIPAGLYLAQLTSVKGVKAKESGTEGEELTFEILSGQYQGHEVKDTIWKSPKAANRIRLFAARLGLLKIVGEGKDARYERIEGKRNFADAFGERCVIDVVIDESDSKKNPGEKYRTNRLAFTGIYRLDDPKSKGVLAGIKDLPPSTPKQATPPKPDPFANL